MRLRGILFAMLAATACAAPSATDLVVPQDGVHVSGAAQLFFPTSSAAQCQSRQYTGATGKNVTVLNYNSQGGRPSANAKFMNFSITGYHGAGSYAINKKPTGATPIAPDNYVSFYVGGTGGAWIADGGTITVIATGGTTRGTVNVQKTWAKGPPTTANATIQGTWTCTVQSTPSPFMIGG